MPKLVVDFDGLLNPMPEGWFALGSHKNENAHNAVKFLCAATEYFEVYIWGPRCEIFGGIQSVQAAIIDWTTMSVNVETMHDLMNLLWFPTQQPTEYDVWITGTGVKWAKTKDELDPELIQFVNLWQEELAAKARSPRITQSTGAGRSAERDRVGVSVSDEELVALVQTERRINNGRKAM